MARLWDKGKGIDDFALKFTVGDDHLLDTRLLPFDIEGSVAHVKALKAAGYLSEDELGSLLKAYQQLRAEAESGTLKVSIEDEDSHTAIENRLTELLGELGAKIHTGRSRNDQAVTMLRLAMRETARAMAASIVSVADALTALAQKYEGIPLPGYSHLQPAMPSSVPAWALGYAEVLCERAESLLSLRKHLARSALGSAAGYGAPIKLSREVAAREQGFKRVQAVTAVQLTRGLDELAFVQQLQLVGLVVSRMAADLVLFATREFGLARLPADLTTGSSIMPNKANPDILELIRAHGAALGGHPATIASVLSCLPGGYQRDLQLIKKSLMAAIDDCRNLLAATELAVAGVAFDATACHKAMGNELYATACAYHLMKDGTPFRQAYLKASQSPDQWRKRDPEPGAESADSGEYCGRLLGELSERMASIRESVSG